mgnify:CR=1 FL=1
MSVLSIRGIDRRLYQRVKAVAALRGIKVGDAINEAMRIWLSIKPQVLATFEEIEREAEINRRKYCEVRDNLVRKYRGMYVAIAKGDLLGVFSSLEEAARAVEETGARHGIVERLLEEEVGEVDLGWSLVELE